MGPDRGRSGGRGRTHTGVLWSGTRHWWQHETSRRDDTPHNDYLTTYSEFPWVIGMIHVCMNATGEQPN